MRRLLFLMSLVSPLVAGQVGCRCCGSPCYTASNVSYNEVYEESPAAATGVPVTQQPTTEGRIAEQAPVPLTDQIPPIPVAEDR